MIDKVLTKSSESAVYKVLSLALILGLLGALGNAFPLQSGNLIQLHFGYVAVLVAASLFFPWVAFPVAVISVIPGIYAGLSFWSILIYLAGALWVSLLRGRGYAVIVSSTVYWVVILLPIMMLLQQGKLDTLFWIDVLELMLNGLLMAAVAQLLLDGAHLSHLTQRISQYPVLRERLRAMMVRVMCAFALLLSLGLGLALNQTYEERQAYNQQHHMMREADILASMLQEYLDAHVRVIQTTAKQLSSLSDAEAEKLLRSVQQARPGFLTMLRADQRGRVVQAAPEYMLQRAKQDMLNVVDREYFRVPMQERRTFISSPFVGRGFGRDVIVAISAPILDPSNNVLGVVEGSLDLERIGRFQSFDLSAENNRVVMTDERNNVLFASPGLGLSAMDNFGLTRAGGRDLFIDSVGNDYSYAAQEISEGWKVFVLHKTSIALANVLQHFVSLFITLGFITVAAVLVSARFAISLSVPITRLVENIRDGKASDVMPESLDVDEIHALYNSYYDNKRRIEYQQQHLEEQVYRRSMDLLEANNKLSRQAYTDGLTGLDNLRALSERFSQLRSLAHRNNGRLLVLYVDIDYLSRINDTYGHDKGDQCIKSLGEVLRHCFQRDYDILARLGSDEFVVITQVFDWDVLSNYIDVCRLKIESSALPIGAGRNVNVTVSMGGFVAEAGWSHYYEDWLQIASQTMQSAKQQGRNCLLTREDNPRNKIAVPSVALASRDIEQHQGVFIEPLHDGLLNARFEHLRSSLSRSGGALMVAKFAFHSHDADDVGLQRGCCRDLLQIFRRGYDTVAMLDEQHCLVVTAVTHREEAERLIERALYHLLKQQPAIESQLMAGAVLAEATWHSDFNEWLSVCDTKLTEIEPDTLRRFKLMCLTGRVY